MRVCGCVCECACVYVNVSRYECVWICVDALCKMCVKLHDCITSRLSPSLECIQAIYLCVDVCIFPWVFVYMYVYMYIRHAHMCMCVYVCVCVKCARSGWITSRLSPSLECIQASITLRPWDVIQPSPQLVHSPNTYHVVGYEFRLNQIDKSIRLIQDVARIKVKFRPCDVS